MPHIAELAYFTPDVAAMAAFYEQVLGVAPVARSDDMAIFTAGSTKVFIHKTYTPGDGDLPPENHVALAVPDVDKACQALASAGISIERPPQDYYWGRSAYLRDPEGRLIELSQAS
jgi:catechol 2,3-dioxygenase-like lactoylglutathione lyase family enzyme